MHVGLYSENLISFINGLRWSTRNAIISGIKTIAAGSFKPNQHIMGCKLWLKNKLVCKKVG